MSQESSAAIDLGIRRLLQSAEEVFVTGAQLEPCPVPVGLALLEGSLDGVPLFLRTRRYHGSCCEAFTVATLESQQRLRSLTVIGLPPPGAPWPVLGIDIIALRGTISLAAIDLAPTDLSFWEAHCAELLTEFRALTQEALLPRKRPEFAAETFSSLAVIAGVRAGKEAPFFAAVELLFQRLVQTLEQATAVKSFRAAQKRREQWLAAEKHNRKEQSALTRMFGPTVAASYLDGFLLTSEQGATQR